MSLPNNLRLRPDLIVQQQDASAGTWVVKDPVSLRFFLFGADEHFILQRLTGNLSVAEIIDDFARHRAPLRLTAQRLHAFLSSLHQNGLICSDAPGQGKLMLERKSKQQTREIVLQWTNLLAIRLPGINPDRWLDRLYPALRWCFSSWFLTLAMLLCTAALSIVVLETDTLRSGWPRMEEFLSGRNLLLLFATLAGIKVLHEIAHALTCKHFGGRCHELGVMFLVFTPCLYCNVTDAWMLRSRRQRIAISAAGIVTELILASAAVIAWRYTQPGALHAICLNIIVVCSVGTLLFNGNPLLKYDGYYILSDWIRVPNLWQESRAELHGAVRNFFTRRAPGQDNAGQPQRRGLLMLYAVASIMYRIALTFAILLFLYRWLHPAGFDALVVLVGATIVGQTAYAWARPAARWHADPRRFERLRKVRFAAAAAIVGGGAAALAVVPWKCTITAPAVLQTSDAQRVYVTTPGALVASIDPNRSVQLGDLLAELKNTELENEILRIRGDLNRARARVDALTAQAGEESAAASQLLVAQEIAADLEQQLSLRTREQDALTIRAPGDGVVIPPPETRINDQQGRQLPAWSGTPLDRQNVGSYLERGALLCLVGHLESCDAIALVDETDVPYVRIGDAVRVQLEHARTDILVGKVAEIAELNAETTPPELAIPRTIAVRTEDGLTPVRTTYQVRVELEPSNAPRLLGARGTAKIVVAPQTALERIARWWSRTIKAE